MNKGYKQIEASIERKSDAIMHRPIAIFLIGLSD